MTNGRYNFSGFGVHALACSPVCAESDKLKLVLRTLRSATRPFGLWASSLLRHSCFVIRHLSVLILWAACVFARAAEPPKPTEADYYPLITIPIPANIVLEVGAIEL